jgi:hypothetical protein
MEKADVSKPDVYCPRERRRVPIWWCLGSLVQRKEPCPELIEARVDFPENRAEVGCKVRRGRGRYCSPGTDPHRKGLTSGKNLSPKRAMDKGGADEVTKKLRELFLRCFTSCGCPFMRSYRPGVGK